MKKSSTIKFELGSVQYQEHLAVYKQYSTSPQNNSNDRLRQLNEAIKYTVKNSPYYRNKNIWPTVESFDELAKLPFTSKQDVKNSYPYGMLAISNNQLSRYAESSGTSGQYSSGYVTRHDWLSNNIQVCLSWSKILTAKDILAVVVPYELTYVGADIDRVAELLNVGVISIGTNNKLCPWSRLITLIKSHSITTLFCSPTRAIRLAQLMTESGGEPMISTVNKIICVGESCSEAKRKYIGDCWDAVVYNHYGMTEAMAVATPCPEQKMHLCEQRLVAEVINEEEVVNEGGATGELILTSLDTQAMPLLRYKTGDLVQLQQTPCPCGNPNRTINHLGRVTDVFNTPKGICHFHQLDEVLFQFNEIEPYFSYSYRDSVLYISVILKESASDNSSSVRKKIENATEKTFNISAKITLEEANQKLHSIDNSSKPGITTQSIEHKQLFKEVYS